MSEVPTSWVLAGVLDIAELLRGVTYSKSDANDTSFDGSIPVLRANNIQDRGFDLRDLVYVPERLVAESQRIRKGDVVVATSSGSISVVGKAAQARSDMQAGFGAFCGLFRPSRHIEARYFGHYFSSEAYRTAVSSMARGVNINNLKRDHFAALLLPLAPVNEQKRIADKLDAVLAQVDACRERLNRVPAILKRFRQSVLAAATSGKLTEEWRQENSASESGRDVVEKDCLRKQKLLNGDPSLAKKKSTVQSALDVNYVFEIPNEWAFSTWGVVSEWITYGFTRPMPHAHAGVPLLTARDIQESVVDFQRAEYTTASAFKALSEKDRPKCGDLLVTKDGTIGRAALVRTEAPFCINQSVAVCWLRSTTMDKNYLELVANAGFTQEFIRDKARGMAIQHLSITDFAQCPLPVPPLREQNEIARRVKYLFASADRLEALYTSARGYAERLTPALLSKAFRGGLVPQDPNDEPASALLERIRAARAAAPAKPKMRGGGDLPKKAQKAEVIMLNRKDIRSAHLTTILKERGPLTAEALWSASELDIDDFYDQLKDEETRGLLREERSNSLTAPRMLEAA